MVAVTPRTETRRSVLPWRRHQVDVALAPLLEAYLEGHKKADTTRIEAAYDVALEAHSEQVRRSGELYISHPLGVARILADLGLDDVTIAAALLHDAVEDTPLTKEQLEELFGGEVAAIVDGVTKLDRMEFESRLAQQAATMRKMLVAMANDIRVLLIKLADRLHNMRTIASLPEAKQSRIARETLDIYAPLAHRLGIGDIKWQLEDLAFAVLHPKRYAEIEHLVATALARTRCRPRRRARRDPPAARGAAHRGRGHRPAEALLVDLREDGRARQGLRRGPRPARGARRRRLGEGLLRRARLDPRVVATGPGSLQGLHRAAEVQPLPVAPHHRGGTGRPSGRGADPDRGHEPARRVRCRRALGLQGVGVGQERDRLRAGSSASSSGSTRPRTPSSS